MNSNDVLKMMEKVASDPLFVQFGIKKSDHSIICKSEKGWKQVRFDYYNSYDRSRDDLALRVRPVYEIRFHILHKWFEKYCQRSISDQRTDDSICFTNDMIGGVEEFFFLESRKEYNKDLDAMHNEVVKNAKMVFSKFSTLNDIYDYKILSVIRGEKEFPDVSFEWVIQYLILSRIVAPQDYEIVKRLILERVDYMYGRKEPNVEKYYDSLPEIMKDLEETDFTTGKWGKLL